MVGRHRSRQRRKAATRIWSRGCAAGAPGWPKNWRDSPRNNLLEGIERVSHVRRVLCALTNGRFELLDSVVNSPNLGAVITYKCPAIHLQVHFNHTRNSPSTMSRLDHRSPSGRSL